MIQLVPRSKNGHGIFVFCNTCRTSISSSNKCKHKEKWVYKADFRINNKRRTRVLQSKSINQAIVELASIKLNIEQNNSPVKSQSTTKVTMNEALESYIDYIHNKNGFESEISNTAGHLNDCKRVLSRFYESLHLSGINTANEDVNKLGVNTLSPFYQLIKTKYNVIKQPTKDRHTRIMRHFINYLNNSNLYEKSNFFKTIKTKKTNKQPESITEIELKNTLDSINYENGWVEMKKGRRNVYSSWLKDAIKLGQLTGLRREELFTIKWEDINNYNGVDILHVKDLKNSRQGKEDVFKPIGIDEEFSKFLAQLKAKNCEGKILLTNLKVTSACDKLSRAFTHYFNVGNPTSKQKYFKQIRKQKITDISAYLGKDTYLASGHSSQGVPDSHYIDRLEAVIKYMKLKKQSQ
ncbi:MAG TPA: hypothetical protein VFD80_10340 [Flavobacteriaceae bacterium]|nr:hypothetical protein [Flavobacteriaceae bacterium]